jgi:hypothetical protein
VPAEFFVDENDLALGKALDEQYGTVVYPGHPDLPAVPRGSLDDEWLPVVGQARLVVITRDQRIRYRTVEKQLWKGHRVRGFVLTGRTSQSTETSLRILARHWSELTSLAAARPDGPWMYAVTTDRVHEIALG